MLWSKVYHAPLLRIQCDRVGAGLLMHEGMPKILGNLRIRLGDRVTLNGEQVWIAAGSGAAKTLDVGDDTSLGQRPALIVGESINIGRHVLFAKRVSLVGYDGHPLDPFARARGEAPGSDRSGSITINDYAWIGTEAMIMKGVTVGRGAIVAARSVVRTSVPDLAIVAGDPARVRVS